MRDRGRAGAHGYLAAFLDGATLEAAWRQVRRERRFGISARRTLRCAHLVLRRHARVTPEAASVALVTEAGATIEEAAAIVGIGAARLRLLLANERTSVAGRTTSWVSLSPARRDVLWPAVATVWLAVLAVAILPGQGAARGPALLLAQPGTELALSAVAAARPASVEPGADLQATVAVVNGGPGDARDVTAWLDTSDGLVPSSGSGTLSLVAGSGTDTQAFSSADLVGDVGVTVEAIPAGTAAQFEVALQVPADLEDGTQLGFVARVQVPDYGELESARAIATVERRPAPREVEPAERLADTGFRLVPALLLATVLLAGGALLLRRSQGAAA